MAYDSTSDPSTDEPEALEIWRDHFHLAADPFALTPDPSFLYLSEGHAEALAALKLGLLESRGLMVMIGEVGTGKTTIVYSLLSCLGPRIETAYFSNTALSFEEMLLVALKDFGVTPAGQRTIDLLDALNGFLLGCAEQGKTAALIVDEAQNLSDETFERLRLLLNFETHKRKLLQIVLVGQPELAERLANPQLRQIADRIAIRCHLNPLSSQSARSYVAHRLETAGGSADVFTRAARSLLLRKARGFPRRINCLGHNAMLFAYGRGVDRVDRSLVARAARNKAGKGLARLPDPGRWHHNGRGLRHSFLTSRKLLLATSSIIVLAAAAVALSPKSSPGSHPSTPKTETAAVTAHQADFSLPPAAHQDEAPSNPTAPSPIAEQGSDAGHPSPDGLARTTARLRLRAGPGLEHATVTILPLSTRIEILDRRGDWLRARVAGQEGWVAAVYVTIEAPPSPPQDP